MGTLHQRRFIAPSIPAESTARRALPYRIKAAEMLTCADKAPDERLREEFIILAAAYQQLAFRLDQMNCTSTTLLNTPEPTSR